MASEEGRAASPLGRYIAAYLRGDEAALEEFYEQAARDAELERGIFFYHLYEEPRREGPPARVSPELLREALLQQGWEYAEEGGHAYALQEGVPIYLGPLLELLCMEPARLLEWILARDRGAALRSPARTYVGMSYRMEDDRLLRLLPLALRHGGGQVAPEVLAGGVKRVFLPYPAAQITSAAYLVERALALLMYRVCVIDGFAYGPDLARVRAETLVEGRPA